MPVEVNSATNRNGAWSCRIGLGILILGRAHSGAGAAALRRKLLGAEGRARVTCFGKRSRGREEITMRGGESYALKLLAGNASDLGVFSF